jgi:ubiquinone biosynthesis accessory factor UbiK
MINPKEVNKLVQEIVNSLPAGLKQLPQDIEQQLKVAMQSAFTKLDLVTREEFDTQTKVLQKTRLKLEALEKQVAEMDVANKEK